jgi:hypothetical protein
MPDIHPLPKFGASAQGHRAQGPVDHRALLFRDGLLIALMIHRPLRISNMAAIELNQHLRRTKGGVRLAFEAAEMKSARPYSCVVPKGLSAALERYLSEFRPRLEQRRSSGCASAALLAGTWRPGAEAGCGGGHPAAADPRGLWDRAWSGKVGFWVALLASP